MHERRLGASLVTIKLSPTRRHRGGDELPETYRPRKGDRSFIGEIDGMRLIIAIMQRISRVARLNGLSLI